MRMLSPLENLKAFAVNKPPMVVFTACLAIFAIAAMTLSYYLRGGPVPNPDIKMDWNVIVDHMSQWDMCVITASHLRGKPISIGRNEPFLKHHENFQALSSWQDGVLHDGNGSVSIALHLRLGFRMPRAPRDMEILWGTVSMADLGYDAKSIDSNYPLSVVMDLGKLTNCTTTDYMYCDVTPDACVTFYGPVTHLPRVKEPDTCLPRKVKQVDATFAVLNSVESKPMQYSCSGLSVVQEYFHDPSFQENLSYSEQTLMNMHLIYTSYFLFVMAMTVLCYASVRGQTKTQTLLSEKTANV